MKIIISIILICLVSISALGKEPAKPKDPAKPAQKKAEPKVADIGRWSAYESKDEITDEKILIVSMSARDSGSFSFSSEPTILIRVKGDNLDIFITWDRFLDNDTDIETILRFDDGEPINEAWSPGTNGESIFSKSPNELLDLLLKHKKMVVRVKNFEGTQYTEVFNVKGLANAIKPYRATYFQFLDAGE